MNERDAISGRYEARATPTGWAEVWWTTTGGAPFELLPAWPHSPDGPVRDAADNVALDAARSILLHATGNLEVAWNSADEFRAQVLDVHPSDRDLRLPLAEVEGWLTARGILLARDWGPLGREPVINWTRDADGVECYTVSLDDGDLLRVDLAGPAPVARVGVTDLTGRTGLRWSRPVTVAEPGDGHTPAAPGERVRTDRLPFGGWAVQVDGFDVAIVERSPSPLTHARVAVYDHGLDSGFLVFDECVRYRQLTAERVSIGERLRRLTGTAGRSRVLGR